MRSRFLNSIFILIVSSLIFSACASVSGTALKRAAYDFDCPEKEIVLKNVAGDSYLAQGCGKKQLYLCSQTSGNDAATATYSCWPENASHRTVSKAGMNGNSDHLLQMQMMQQVPPPAPTGFH